MHIHTSIYTYIFHSMWTPQTSTLMKHTKACFDVLMINMTKIVQ